MKTNRRILSNISELRSLLHRMEVDAGLDDLSGAERDVLYAVMASTETKGDVVRSEDIRQNDLACHLTEPTYQRALRSLLEKGYIRRAPGTQRGAYQVS